jgi:hypothetical protein
MVISTPPNTHRSNQIMTLKLAGVGDLIDFRGCLNFLRMPDPRQRQAAAVDNIKLLQSKASSLFIMCSGITPIYRCDARAARAGPATGSALAQINA